MVKTRNKRLLSPQVTFTCKISSGQYARLLFTNVFLDHYLWLLLAFAVFLILSILDIRFIIVALMVVFIVLPMIASLLYINYLLTPETRWSIVEKQVDLLNDGVRLTFLDGKTRSVMLTREDVTGVYKKADLIVLQLSVRRYQYFVIPDSVFENEKQQEKFLAAFI